MQRGLFADDDRSRPQHCRSSTWMQPGNIRYVWAGLSRAQPALLPPPLAGSGSCPAGQSSPGSAGARRQTNRTVLHLCSATASLWHADAVPRRLRGDREKGIWTGHACVLLSHACISVRLRSHPHSCSLMCTARCTGLVSLGLSLVPKFLAKWIL